MRSELKAMPFFRSVCTPGPCHGRVLRPPGGGWLLAPGGTDRGYGPVRRPGACTSAAFDFGSVGHMAPKKRAAGAKRGTSTRGRDKRPPGQPPITAFTTTINANKAAAQGARGTDDDFEDEDDDQLPPGWTKIPGGAGPRGGMRDTFVGPSSEPCRSSREAWVRYNDHQKIEERRAPSKPRSAGGASVAAGPAPRAPSQPKTTSHTRGQRPSRCKPGANDDCSSVRAAGKRARSGTEAATARQSLLPASAGKKRGRAQAPAMSDSDSDALSSDPETEEARGEKGKQTPALLQLFHEYKLARVEYGRSIPGSIEQIDIYYGDGSKQSRAVRVPLDEAERIEKVRERAWPATVAHWATTGGRAPLINCLGVRPCPCSPTRPERAPEAPGSAQGDDQGTQLGTQGSRGRCRLDGVPAPEQWKGHVFLLAHGPDVRAALTAPGPGSVG